MTNYFFRIVPTILFIILITFPICSQEYKILKSDNSHLLIEFDFSKGFEVKDLLVDGIKFTSIEDVKYPMQKPGDPFLPTRDFEIGIPMNSNASVTILDAEREILSDKFVIATPDSIDQPLSQLKYNQDVYGFNASFPLEPASIQSQAIFRYIKTASLSISPFQFNPVQRILIRYKKIVVRIDFVNDYEFRSQLTPIRDKMTETLVNNSLINAKDAINFLGKVSSQKESLLDKFWYDPSKNYTKLYLNQKGVYRVTHQALVEAGLPSNDLIDMRFELFNDSLSIPLDIVDKDSNGFFNNGDYFQFIGKPVKPHDAYSGLNIYNKTNVYWFSYQADSTNFYIERDGYPTNGFNLITNTLETIKYEEDKLFSHLGYANDDRRDYWYWDFAEYRTGGYSRYFQNIITDSIWYNFHLPKPQMKIKIGLHGLTNTNCGTGFSHSAQLLFNGFPSGTVKWNGQNQATFEKDFYISFSSASPDTLFLNWENVQEIIVRADGDICDTTLSDLFLVNNFEIQYWRQLRTYPNHFYFTSPPFDYGENVYWMYQWFRDNMKIYIPNRNEVINNPWITNDASNSVRFVDTLYSSTDYYCVADDYFLLPDSISMKTNNSDLRNLSNGADYIIITHPAFTDAAQRLAVFRSTHLTGYESPRVQIVNVLDIYDEFSYGLMNPIALQYFVKYAFDNWQQPAPAYITLMGDLSSDYRKILPNSRQNYIPSPPYHSIIYGQAASDNGIVTIAGNDLVPELAIGRLSCETIDEANVLVDRIINYPAEIRKQWKQNVLLLSSGLSASDENQFKFNDRNMTLANLYIDPAGIKSTKIFRYPNKPEYIQYQGEGPDIRREIDNGTVMVNYYGHGGGFQWDLVFTDDDIRALNNGNMMPFVISVTCYTAHFDNQEIFGEIFNSEPEKGSIAFFGSSGVTFWPTTANFNQDLFREFFKNKRHVIGDAILIAKSNPGYGTMLALLTLLGDPALELALPYEADFVLKPSSITIEPNNPLIDDTVQVKVVIENPGRIWIGDSVKVHLYENIISDSTLIGLNRLGSFGEKDSTFFTWIPRTDGVVNLLAIVNDDQMVVEIDHSDNSAVQSFSVFSIDKPKLLKPAPNYFTNKNVIDFVIVDIGHFVLQDFSYKVVIDTSRDLNSPIKITSPILTANNGMAKWSTPQLTTGEYFYEVHIFSIADTNKTDLQTFSITPNIGTGYLAQNQQLKDFTNSNILYSETDKALVLNIEPLPPRPGSDRLLDSLIVQRPVDNTEITAFTNDGTYLYFSNVSYYREGSKSKIYKVGTGYNGTVKAQLYGSIANLEVEVKNTIFYHSDGFLYASTGDDSTLLRINIDNGDTVRINIPSRLLPTEDGILRNGGFYLNSDGRYVYNLSAGYGEYRNKYLLRTFDPSLGWAKVGEDVVFDGVSAYGFSSFYIYAGHLQTYESYIGGYMRKYRLADGFFEEEYLSFLETKKVYSWSYDWTNNILWGGLFTPAVLNYDFGFYKCVGSYVEASGNLTSQNVGPARQWKTISYELESTGSTGFYSSILFGQNSNTLSWDTLLTNLAPTTNIGAVDSKQYPFLKLYIDMVDSSLGVSEPLKFRALKIDFELFPELNLFPDKVEFNPDSLLQGFPVELSFKVDNIGYTQADSLKLDFYHNLLDTVFYSVKVDVPADTSITITKIISTDNLLYSAPVSPIDVNVVATSTIPEYYTFNNFSNGNFNVVRDSANPSFNITFDGREILIGDIISSEPEIVITLEDNSPLPIDSTYFTIVHTYKNVPKVLTVPGPDITFESTPYPNNRAVITWKPKLLDDRHVLEVLAKDASGNFFDSTSSRSVFYVFNNPALLQVYNYPNPFSDNTYFTFELRGVIPPEEFKIKIFTVAGRLIRELMPSTPLQIGFNKIYWDGKDQDGDEIANGLYFYKIISKHGDEVKTVTQKLAKVK